MTSGAIGPRLARLAWPLVAGNLLQTAYNLADMFWVGRVGSNAVAAVSLMFPTAWLFVSTAMGITAAAVALVSQNIGAERERRAERVVGQTVLLAVAGGLFLAAFGFAIRYPLIHALGAQGPVFPKALAYAEVMFVTIPFTFLFFSFRAVLRGAGDTRTAMWLVVVSAGMNVVIDPFLILGWWGLPALGVRGAAIATLASRALAALVGLAILVHGGWGIRLRLADLAPDPRLLRQLVDVGYPSTLDGLARSLAAVTMVGLVARFGAVPTAAYGIVLRYQSISWTLAGAVGQATATGVGQNLGAGSLDRSRAVTRTGTLGTMGLLAAASALVFVFPEAAMGVFIDDAAVVASGITMFHIVAPFWAFFGGLMVIQGGFRGAGRTRAAFVLSMLSRWVIRIPLAAALAFGLAWGPTGLWWGMATSAFVSFLVGAAWFVRSGWSEGVIEERGGSEDGEGETPAPGATPSGQSGVEPED
ncbi:MAG: MATE family efflux transporter [Halodesulfurarchaeum sp.]